MATFLYALANTHIRGRMEEYTRRRLREVTDSNTDSRKQRALIVQTIPITERGLLTLAFGGTCERAVLREGTRVLSVIHEPRKCRTLSTILPNPVRALDFFGENTQLHAYLGTYSLAVDFYCDPDEALPSLSVQILPERQWTATLTDGAYSTPATVTSESGSVHECLCVYTGTFIGLKKAN